MISREDAIETLVFLESNDIISEDLQGKLMDIRTCIEEELQGRHMWGAADDEFMALHTAWREDLWTEDKIKECKEIAERHTFTPAPYEADEIGKEEEQADEH